MSQSMRTRTNERHLTAQDINKLGQFIDACGPQDAAQVRYTFVIASCLVNFATVLQYLHGAELVDGEWMTVKSSSVLPEYYRASRGQLNQNAHHSQKRRKNDKEDCREYQINGTLHCEFEKSQ